MSCFKKVRHSSAPVMSVHADVVKNFGNTVSYNSVDLTKENIDVDASIFNDPIAQAAAVIMYLIFK